MAYVHANIPHGDELFMRLMMRASSFQESLEAELKTNYKTEDACRHPGYLEE